MFGLTFANPAVLYALWAAALPTLIHLLNRRRSVTVSFSNVALLQSLQQDRMRRVRLKQWLLLVTRTLLIAFLVLAFARPTVREGGLGHGRGETNAVFLLDRSLSTQARVGGRTVLAASRDRAAEALTLFDAGDVVSLVTFDDRAEPTDPAPPERARIALAGVEATYRRTDPVPAVDAARRILRGSEAVNRELYLFSDFARAGWEDLRDAYDGFEGTTVFLVRSAEPATANVGVRTIRTDGLSLAAGETLRLVAEIQNFGSRRVNELPVQVFADDQRIGQKVIAVGPGERARVSFRYTPEQGGARAFRVEIPDDALPGDNVRTTIVHVPDRIRVGLVGEPDAKYYVGEALRSAGKTGLLVEDADASTDGYDVVVLCGVRRPGRGEVAAIRRQVEAGAGALVTLGEGIDVRVYNEQVFPALAPATITGVAGRRGDQGRFTTFDPAAADHPVTRDLIGKAIPSPRFYVNYDVTAGPGTRTLVSYASGSPAVLERALGAGRVMVLTSHPDLEWTDLPLTGFFAPFAHRAARYLSTGAFGSDDVPVGRRAIRPVKDGATREAVVRPPRGPLQTVWTQQIGDRTSRVIEDVSIPGVWEVFANERLIDRFAAQVSPDEGDPTPIDPGALTRLFPGAEVVPVGPDQALPEVVARYRHGAELWRAFLVAALALAAVELMLMSGETRSRAS